MNEEKFKYQMAGLKWLYEMEMLDDPQLINNLKLNIFACSNYIKECEFVMDQSDRKMLIWIELSFWGRTFYKKRIYQDVIDILGQLLPNFKFRVTSDRQIIELAITKLQRSLKGGTYAVSLNADTIKSDSTGKDQLQETPDILPDEEESDQSEAEDESSENDENIESDLQHEPETQS